MIYIIKNNFLTFIYLIIICMIMDSCGEDSIYGCTDSTACNYNALATEENDSCIYAIDIYPDGLYDCDGVCYSDLNGDGICDVVGCMDETAFNYNSEADIDDGSCEYSLSINFHHVVDGADIIFGNENIIYQNNASNMYSVRRILYVLSDVVLYFDNDVLELEDFIFINTDIPETLIYSINELPALCSGISFRIGFSSQENVENAYINVSNNFHNSMLWPNLNDPLSPFQGGYHYMKLEGKYMDLLEGEYFYNTHTGPTGAEDFSILYSEFNFAPSQNITVEMNVNNWYNNPTYDLGSFGPGIMDNIIAQSELFDNGLDVFSVESE